MQIQIPPRYLYTIQLSKTKSIITQGRLTPSQDKRLLSIFDIELTLVPSCVPEYALPPFGSEDFFSIDPRRT
jgi:hypothetical protein